MHRTKPVWVFGAEQLLVGTIPHLTEIFGNAQISLIKAGYHIKHNKDHRSLLLFFSFDVISL